MKKRAIITVITKYAQLGLAISLVLLGYGIIGAILSILIVKAGQLIILSIIIQNKIPFKKPNFSSVKEYISFGLPIIPKSVFGMIINMSDRYVIGFFLGATSVGYYTPGYGLGMMLPKFLGGTLSIVLLPSLSEFFEEDNIAAVKNIMKLSTKYFLLVSIPAFIGLIFVSKPILSWFTTPEIAQEGYIIFVLSSIAGIFVGLHTIFAKTLYLEKRTKLLTVFVGIGAGINIFGNIIFVPSIGIIAAGITTIISYLVITILIMYFSFKKLPISLDYSSIGKIIMSSILMGLLLFFFRQYIYPNPFFLIAIGIIAYFSILYFIGGLKKKEIHYLKDLYR